MKIDKGTINASPFVGVFMVVTEDIALIPPNIQQKEEDKLRRLFDVTFVKTKLADSSLIGALCTGLKDRFVVSEFVLDSELASLEKAGLKVKRVKGLTAVGNLVRANEKGGIASRVLTKEQLSQIESFLKIKLTVTKVASLDIVGSATIATNNGFIVNPDVTKEEFEVLKKCFGTDGVASTLNYGDRFVGNDAVANSEAMLIGNRTTTYELLRIQNVFV